jgi:hypothetical protein
MSRAGFERMIRQLGRLSVVQRARAARWLARARTEIRFRLGEADSGGALTALSTLEDALTGGAPAAE